MDLHLELEGCVGFDEWIVILDEGLDDWEKC